ncbi:MAG: hypothetical protein KDD62_13240 [Bdellovibrionales bacterium]|nr:hypothetical protein [Bdellovibrionales bacterium]
MLTLFSPGAAESRVNNIQLVAEEYEEFPKSGSRQATLDRILELSLDLLESGHGSLRKEYAGGVSFDLEFASYGSIVLRTYHFCNETRNDNYFGVIVFDGEQELGGVTGGPAQRIFELALALS